MHPYSLKFYIIITAILITGCTTSCPTVIKNHGERLEFSGIEVPVRSLTPVKVGKIVYDPVQLQEITDTIQAIDQYRLSQCVLIEQLSKLNPSPVKEIVEISKTITSANSGILAIAASLKTATNPATVINVATEKAAEITKPSPPETPHDIKTTPSASSIEGRLDSIEKSAHNFYASWNNRKRTKITVFPISGFSPGQIALNPTMKASISRILQDLEQTVSNPNFFVLDLVGYADSTGSYLDNLQLGLARAKSVASYISSNHLKYSNLRLVSSGGIAPVGENGKRVDLHIMNAGL